MEPERWPSPEQDRDQTIRELRGELHLAQERLTAAIAEIAATDKALKDALALIVYLAGRE